MSRPSIDRRQFLSSAAAATAFFAVHDLPLLHGQGIATPQEEPKRPRILSLELLTGAPMSAMRAFYGKTLDLRLLDERSDRFTVEAGETRLTFAASPDTADGRAPFYHFAFNIPENKIVKALEWQRARTPMLAIPERNRAAGFPSEVVDYRHWNAHSIFFLDPAGNVVEYIARHDLKNGDSHPFGWSDLLYVSEIAVVVDDVTTAAAAIAGITGLPPYKGGDAGFTAMGDEYGLVLVMKRGRVIDFTGNAANGVRVYRTGVNLRGAKTAAHQLLPYPYHLTIEERCSCG
jgi:catechol-2,3-dioxygenase